MTGIADVLDARWRKTDIPIPVQCFGTTRAIRRGIARGTIAETKLQSERRSWGSSAMSGMAQNKWGGRGGKWGFDRGSDDRGMGGGISGVPTGEGTTVGGYAGTAG